MEAATVTVGEVKCVRCEYFGRHPDAPETVDKDCMWEMLREEGTSSIPPCEED